LVASSITFACANVQESIDVISSASFNPPIFPTMFAAVSEILYATVFDIAANFAAWVAFAVAEVTL